MTPKIALLLLTVVLMAGVTTATEPATPSGSSANLTASLAGSAPLQANEGVPSGAGTESSVTPSDYICYKIHAFLFKRDDDHAPQFIGSTTCGPRQPHAKNAEWPKAKLVPAK